MGGYGVESERYVLGAGRGSVGDVNMTMKEKLETAINGIRADSKILALDEKSARAEVIDPILERLGWDKFGKEFVREFSVSDGRVDYALLNNGKPKVFIEAKRPNELLNPHQYQLLAYSGRYAVRLAALTNGLNWWFYLPLAEEGDAEERRFCQLDITRDDVSEACDLLSKFLSMENVASRAAVESAEAHLRRLQDARKVDKALPRAWKELIDGPDELLVELISERVKDLCGIEATAERIKLYLLELKPALREAVSESRSTSTPQETLQRHNLVRSRNIRDQARQTEKSFEHSKHFIFCGEKFAVRSHRQVLPTLAREIYKRHSHEFDKVINLAGWYTSGSAKPSISPEPIVDSGWSVYINLRSNEIEARCYKLLYQFGYREEDLIIQAR